MVTTLLLTQVKLSLLSLLIMQMTLQMTELSLNWSMTAKPSSVLSQLKQQTHILLSLKYQIMMVTKLSILHLAVAI